MDFCTVHLRARHAGRSIAGCLRRLYDIALGPKLKVAPPGQLSGGHLRHTPELDGIRGWACGSVLMLHCFTGILQVPPYSWQWELGNHTFTLFLSGVDLFFVLSGFLIGGLLLDSKHQPHFFKSFWIRRVARILPVVYLVLVTYVVAFSVTTYFGIRRFDSWLLAPSPAPLWTYMTFTQNLPMALAGTTQNDGPKWIVPMWSLSIEEQFYLLFPFTVYFLRRKWIVVLVVCGIVAAPIMREVIDRKFGNAFASYVLPPTRIDSLLFGVAVALIVRNKHAFVVVTRYRRLLDVAALLVLYSVVTNWVFPLWPGTTPVYPLRYGVIAFMWAVMILRIFTYQNSLFNKIWRSSFLVKMGLISYGAYMYNEIANGLVHGWLFNQEPTIKTPEHLLAGIGVFVITLGLATVSYIYFERPIRRYGAAIAKSLARDNERSRILAHAVPE